MGEDGVNGSTNDFGVDLSEFSSLGTELDDFGWANEGEVKWVEEQNNPFAGVVGQFDVNELLLVVSFAFEVWSWLSDGQWSAGLGFHDDEG